TGFARSLIRREMGVKATARPTGEKWLGDEGGRRAAERRMSWELLGGLERLRPTRLGASVGPAGQLLGPGRVGPGTDLLHNRRPELSPVAVGVDHGHGLAAEDRQRMGGVEDPDDGRPFGGVELLEPRGSFVAAEGSLDAANDHLPLFFDGPFLLA